MKAEPVRVVIDSNVWISAALAQDGAPARLVRRVLEQGVAAFSPATFAELETRLWKPKFDRYLSMELRRRLLHDINAAAYWVEVSPDIAALSYCRDADDEKFIHTAVAAQSPWLVTGDRDLLDVPAISGLRILAPSEAILLHEFAAG